MALGRVVRRSVLLLAVAGAGGFVAMNPGVVKAFYEDLYPPDPARRQALDLCFMEDHKFNRLDAAARDDCYRRMLLPLGEVAPTPRDQPNVNLVDLERAASQGTQPRNDIRRLEDNEKNHSAVHPPH
ncbi:MAG TPA: hypothetical protein VG308_03645 [Stellaceae bacterium]|jgi:hypothetical protein|nr:hypothetical protein [Stellaceae bacterium]